MKETGTLGGEVAPRWTRLELAVRRRLQGRLQGEYQGLLPGHGTELGEARLYEPGDDVRRIDWAVTARLDRPHVRDTIADHELIALAVVDRSASLAFGTARRAKGDVALEVCAVVGFAVARGANQFGVLGLTAGDAIWMPPAAGRPHVHATLRRLAATPVAPGTVDLAAGLRTAARLARRRGFVAVVSDFLDRGAWVRPLRALAQRHEVLAIEVVDPREQALPAVGYLTLEDPETGRRRTVDTDDPALRLRFAEAAAKQRAEIATSIRRAGCDHLQLSTDRDWIADIVRHVEQRRRSRTHAQTGRAAAPTT